MICQYWYKNKCYISYKEVSGTIEGFVGDVYSMTNYYNCYTPSHIL